MCNFFDRKLSNIVLYILACEEEWRRLAASAAETRLLSPGMQPLPNQIRATQGTPLGKKICVLKMSRRRIACV